LKPLTAERLAELLNAAANGNVWDVNPNNEEDDLVRALERFIANHIYESQRDHSYD